MITNMKILELVTNSSKYSIFISIRPKGQLISKAIFHGFPYFKKKKLTKFVTFFALVSEMGQIKEIEMNNHTN